MTPAISEIWQWLDAVPDPEIPAVSVVDLGIVRDVAWNGARLTVSVTPTYSGCPATRVIAGDIEDALRARGISDLCVATRLTPPWTTDWISEKGRSELARLGIAPPHPSGGPARCPRCGSRDLSCVSRFGSTPCKALWRCDACREPFEYFKCI